MRKHRLFVKEALSLNSSVDLEPDLSHYVQRVLRLHDNDQVYLFNNSGNEYTATIVAIKRNCVSVNVTEISTEQTESPLQIHLAQVLGKGDKMDLVIQKATELGVKSIIPLYSEHTVVKIIADRVDHKLDHWQKIAIAASCQSWRNYVPTVYAPMALSKWLEQQQDQNKLILSVNPDAAHLKTLNLSGNVTVLIGPEGGFSAAELALAADQKFTAISLGPRILRTETAGVAIVACLQSLFGDG